MSQENVNIVRRAIEAFQRGDITGAFEAAAPDVEGRMFSHGVAQDVVRGDRRAREHIADFFAAWEEPKVEVGEVIDAGDDLVLVQIRWCLRGRVSGLETEREYAAVFTLREGKIVRYRDYESWNEALEAVGLSE